MKRARKKSKIEVLENRIILALAVVIFVLSVFITVKLCTKPGTGSPAYESSIPDAAAGAEADSEASAEAQEIPDTVQSDELLSHIYSLD